MTSKIKKPNLSISIAGLALKNPIMTASGTFGYGLEFQSFLNLNSLGAISIKGLSLQPRTGNPPPRTCETVGGMLNAIGLENVGVETFIKEKLPELRKFSCAIIANIFGEKPEEYVQISRRLCDCEGISALEINVSCPNTQAGGMVFGKDPKLTAEVTQKVKKVSNIPVIVKLSPNVTDITVLAKASEEAGADALSLVNTFVGMSVDIQKKRPHLANVSGGLSGPAIKPLALWLVYQVVRSVSIPVIGMGGIMSLEDVLEFLIVGAKAVQIGTANFIDPSIAEKIAHQLEDYCQSEGIGDINSIIGSLH